MFSDLWNKLKAWFKYSETILLARMESLSGLIIASVSALDWSPMLNLGIDTGASIKQGVILGSIMFVKGITTEWARRRNTVEVDNKLIPTEIVKEVKTEVVTDLPAPVVTTKTDTVTT